MAYRKAGSRALAALAFGVSFLAAEPLRLHPENPRYFLYRGQPTILITSAEHYGAVLNLDFDGAKYLDALAQAGLNYTRIFAGAYREVPGSFNIERNTLAPREGRFLSAFDPAFPERLRGFVRQAAAQGIVVEVTLFCTFYEDKLWELSPLNVKPGVPRQEALTLKHPELTRRQEEHVRRVVAALKDEENVFYEICNEPYFNGVTLEWQRHIAATIAAEERRLGVKHLIAQNIANGRQLVRDPDPNVSILNFHYARPPVTVAENHGLGRVIGCDETGFDGFDDAFYRIQGWDFVIAGGGLYNNLDYSFAVGFEDGTFRAPGTTPGGGSAALRQQLRHLREFMAGFAFVRMAPFAAVTAPDASVSALAEPGKQYAVYLHQARQLPNMRPRYVVQTAEQRTMVELAVPPGRYTARWVDPKTGKTIQETTVENQRSLLSLPSPAYREDIALSLKRL